jgi:hypothetical protein
VGKQVAVALHVVAMAAVIVGVDLGIFRERFCADGECRQCLDVCSFLLEIPQAFMD